MSFAVVKTLPSASCSKQFYHAETHIRVFMPFAVLKPKTRINIRVGQRLSPWSKPRSAQTRVQKFDHGKTHIRVFMPFAVVKPIIPFSTILILDWHFNRPNYRAFPTCYPLEVHFILNFGLDLFRFSIFRYCLDRAFSLPIGSEKCPVDISSFHFERALRGA